MRQKLFSAKAALQEARQDYRKTAQAEAVAAETLKYLRAKSETRTNLQPVYMTLSQIDFDVPLETDIPNALGIFMVWAENLTMKNFAPELIGRFNNSIIRSVKMLDDSIVLLDRIIAARTPSLATKEIESLRGTSLIIDASKLEQSASSPIARPEDEKGGIDFRAIPMTIEPAASARAMANPFASGAGSLANDPELRQIETMLGAGIIPSAERVREFAQERLSSKDAARQAQTILYFIADILKLQEENCLETDAGFKELLTVIETKPLPEIPAAVGAIKSITPKNPRGVPH